MVHDAERGTGRTTRQLESAEKNSAFVWCGDDLDYPRLLIRKMGREDIVPMRYSVLCDGGHRLRGMDRGIVLDHAIVCTLEIEKGVQIAEMMRARRRTRCQ